MDYKKADELKIMKCLSGSHAYGTNTPESDEDYRGLFISPLYYLVGMDVVEQVNNSEGDDVLYEIRKFFKLCADSNPNILELLYIDDKHITYRNEFYNKIRENRQLFMSKKARHTFSGYAVAQLHKIKTHRKYLINPPTRKPTRDAFNLLPINIPDEHLNAINSLPLDFIKDEQKDYASREKQYKKALGEWNSYSEWKAKRNPKRQELEAKFGFDTKHAMHLVRLVNMGEEILRTGNLTVFRPERDELKSIREGSWSYDKVLEFSESIDNRFAELELKSTLPYSSDKVKIRNLLIELLSAFYGVDLGKQ